MLSARKIGAVTVLAFAGVSLILAGAFHANKTKARKAGELAALFAWAENRCSESLTSGVLDALESYRGVDIDAFNDGFITSRTKIERARKTVGLEKTCELLATPFRQVVVGKSLGIGLWAPRFPEPAWEPDARAQNSTSYEKFVGQDSTGTAPPTCRTAPRRGSTGDRAPAQTVARTQSAR